MAELLLVLTPIALLDSTSIIPICIVLLVLLLSGPSPLFRSTALLAGIFVTYLACGLLVLFGLQSVFDAVNAYAVRLWRDPMTEELIFQIFIGLVLVVLGLRMVRARGEQAEEKPPAAMNAGQAFLAGAGMTIVGLPGAVPYLAAIDLILRSDPATGQAVTALVVYNLTFVAPLAAIAALSLALGARSQRLLDSIRAFFDRWGQRLIVTLLLILGALLIADGAGWFLGAPLIPV
ncbi:MAG: GAP family protein [Alphaproteobacteria bacterium]|nr:GAP family protein [Alphaproteobacteria bacterium]